jgi:hypothetical protein
MPHASPYHLDIRTLLEPGSKTQGQLGSCFVIVISSKSPLQDELLEINFAKILSVNRHSRRLFIRVMLFRQLEKG